MARVARLFEEGQANDRFLLEVMTVPNNKNTTVIIGQSGLPGESTTVNCKVTVLYSSSDFDHNEAWEIPPDTKPESKNTHYLLLSYSDMSKKFRQYLCFSLTHQEM